MIDEAQVPQTQPSREARQWAMFCHYAAFFGLVFPFGNLLGPLIVWQIRRESDPYIDQQGKEAVNFQITVTLAMLISCVLMLVIIGFLLLGLVTIVALVLTIIAGIKANEGVPYSYPFTWRPLK
ncbi:DUF4870 domain-containing protein [Pseudomonas schmalbachii]|uniref:DUF4870 domain-containing protein n=1 Tax=Pseudomonas schmalbachii TaxID=2816993 RepID=A0ABS3TW43_9PSED|nr:DUF4870 domain-containing protein [Pseudomonas schmalbachii]MBO3277348.1 DUF4870 domain-containing protein [Pseudomonas schmalbachii]